MCAGYYSCVNVKRFTMTYTHTHVLKCTCVTSQRTQTVILVSLEELRIRGGRKTYFLVDTFSLVSIKILWYVYFILVKTGIYSKRWMHYNAALFTIVHAVLFTTAKIQKQSRCPLTDECIKKIQYINTMEYYSAIKRMT